MTDPTTERTCAICNEELFEHERDYCEDCRDGSCLEDVLDAVLSGKDSEA